jgi:hypothetical protein
VPSSGPRSGLRARSGSQGSGTGGQLPAEDFDDGGVVQAAEPGAPAGHEELLGGGRQRSGYQERGARTVFGIGRASLVDFEHHDFGLKAIPDDLKYVSPEEMRLRGQRARLQRPSTIESPQAGPYHRRVGE